MTGEEKIYRRLQRHLDRQAIGFPRTLSGADIRLLKRLFGPEEARLALALSFKPAPAEQIHARAGTELPLEQVTGLLESMLRKGSVGRKERAGRAYWYLMPLVVGMYEAQDGQPAPEFLSDAHAYMKTLSFGKSFLTVKPSQMRTIPVNRSLAIERSTARYDDVRSIVQEAPGPFAVLPCICRETQRQRSMICTKTSRRETCLAFNHMAAMVLARGRGRELSRDDVLAILEQNEKEGLVLQPANARNPDFICSCCGCCCGMLAVQKMLPRPVDFWTVSYQATIDSTKCTGCGVCASRCQVAAVLMDGKSAISRKARIDPDRCIGCGLCVSTCAAKAVSLGKREPSADIPENEEDYLDRVMANKKGAFGQTVAAIRLLLGIGGHRPKI